MPSSPPEPELVGMAKGAGAVTDTPAPARVELTVKEYAARERVSERTVWVWLAKGAVKCRKTPGGGIRVVVPVAPLKNTEEY